VAAIQNELRSGVFIDNQQGIGEKAGVHIKLRAMV
jgi:hypothetical protein